jgi:hypothetical protein
MKPVDQITEIVKEIELHLQDDDFLVVASDQLDALAVIDKSGASIEPILSIIEQHPDVHMGSPGPLVRFLERFPDEVYVPELLKSIRRSPVPPLTVDVE